MTIPAMSLGWADKRLIGAIAAMFIFVGRFAGMLVTGSGGRRRTRGPRG